MKKKITIVGILLSIGLFVGIGYFYYQKSTKVMSPVGGVQPTQEPVLQELVVWTDPSEFQFSYPKNLTLNPHDEDKENYAHVELTETFHPGSLIVWTKDTKQSTLEAWLKENKITTSIDSTLGSFPAKKYFADDTQKKVVTVTIREGYLYQVEVNVDDDYWNTVGAQVTSSFSFVTPTPGAATQKSQEQTVGNDDSASGDFGMDEEVIE